MKKKTRFRSHLSDVMLVLVCLAVCAVSLFFFWKDLNKSSVRNDKNQIASIYFKHRIAQRKYNDRVVWERLSQNAPLYNEDTLRTADLAQAVIRFKDGTVLDLYENTMLQIFYTEEEGVKISVDGGDIKVDSSEGSKNVVLETAGGSRVKMDAGSRMTATIRPASEVQNFEIQTGNAAVVSEAGIEEPVAAGESVNIEKDGKVTRKPVTVTSVSKDLKLLNLTKKPVPVKLEWKTDSGGEEKTSVTVQTSKTKDFSKIESTFTTEDVTSLDVQAENGTLYWRVFTPDSVEEPVTGKVSVAEVSGVQVESPAAGTEYSYREKLPEISFSWTGNEYASWYRLEVSRTADFLNDVTDAEVEGTDFSVNTLAEGNYFWKVTPFYSLNDTGYSASSETGNFSVVKSTEIKAPEILYPADNSKIIAKNSSETVFAWKSELKDSDYEFVISKDSSFDGVVLKKSTGSTRLNADLSSLSLEDGEYFWKVVRHSGKEDDVNPSSAVRKFILCHYVPGLNRLIYPPEGFKVEAEKVPETRFMWKLADEYTASGAKSLIQISSKSDFSSDVKEFTPEDSYLDNLQLENGKYFWRAGCIAGGKENFAETRSFTVQGPLGTPAFTVPADKAVLLAMKNVQTRFSWNSVPEADFYDLKVFDEAGNLLCEKSGLRENSCGMILPENASRASVQAFAEESEISPSRRGNVSTVAFSLRTPEPVKLMLPENNTLIDGITALHNPVVFSWNSGKDRPSNTRFVLYRVLSSGTEKEIYSAENPKSAVNLDRLGEGTYRWVVRASSAEGIPLDSEKRSFTVTKVPLLARAVILEPENNEVIGPVYLKKNRSIEFNWQKVTGATDYSLALYQKKADGSLKLIHAEKNYRSNSYRFRKLKELDVGDFVWNVTAYSHSRDGFEEQHSPVASGSFSISFELPEKVKTIKPGRMYGE